MKRRAKTGTEATHKEAPDAFGAEESISPRIAKKNANIAERKAATGANLLVLVGTPRSSFFGMARAGTQRVKEGNEEVRRNGHFDRVDKRKTRITRDIVAQGRKSRTSESSPARITVSQQERSRLRRRQGQKQRETRTITNDTDQL
jgi:hypothetical protein